MRNTDSFVHRTGRTGRAGKTGLNIAFAEKHDLKFVKELQDDLKIKINVINNMDSYKAIGEETNTADDSAWQEEQQNALNNEVTRLKKTLVHKRDNSRLEDQVSQLCAYYSELDEETKGVLLENVFTFLLNGKASKLNDNIAGLVTGQSGVHTYLLKTSDKFALEILKKNGLKFLWVDRREQGTQDYLFDAEVNHAALDQLREAGEGVNVTLTQTNEVPDYMLQKFYDVERINKNRYQPDNR